MGRDEIPGQWKAELGAKRASRRSSLAPRGRIGHSKGSRAGPVRGPVAEEIEEPWGPDRPRPGRLRRLADPGSPPDARRTSIGIVGRGLAREVEQRTRSAEELQLVLESFAPEQGLALTAGGLARFMRDLFPAEDDPSRALAAGSGAALGTGGEVEAPTGSALMPRAAERVSSPRRRRLVRAIAAIALSGGAAAVAGLALRGPRSEPSGSISAANPSATLAKDAALEVAERESGGGDEGSGLSPGAVDGGGAAADAGSIALVPPPKTRGISPGKGQNAKRKYDLDSPVLP